MKIAKKRKKREEQKSSSSSGKREEEEEKRAPLLLLLISSVLPLLVKASVMCLYSLLSLKNFFPLYITNNSVSVKRSETLKLTYFC